MVRRTRAAQLARLGVLLLCGASVACAERGPGETQECESGASCEGTKDAFGDDAPSDDARRPLARGTQLDLLLVVDNSIVMLDQQRLLAEALPELVAELANPACVDNDGQAIPAATAGDPCPAGSVRRFAPFDDVHIGIVTSSLGGYGAQRDCVALESRPGSEQAVDMAHLLGSLPRGRDIAPDFVSWNDSMVPETQGALAGEQVLTAGELGCGWESPLEAMVRFLIDPAPYTRMVRINCPDTLDQDRLCIGPERGDRGEPLVDSDVLTQRQQFLRPSSTVAVVLLSNENDCSFVASGQSWRLAQATNPDEEAVTDGPIQRAFRATSICETDPNDECCHSCGSTRSGCPTEPLEGTDFEVGLGCGAGRLYLQAGELPAGEVAQDELNLRCFDQKRRFGVDYLYPVQRYINALSSALLCTIDDEFSPDSDCHGNEFKIPNPLYFTDGELLRDPRQVFFMSIVGVPWVDLAAESAADGPLRYKLNSGSAADALDWDLILGTRGSSGLRQSLDPLMHESIEPRTGTHPLTGEPLGPPDAFDPWANTINGHEWQNVHRYQLQPACAFPVPERVCPSEEEADALRAEGLAVPPCPCTYLDSAAENTDSRCQAEDGSYGAIQRAASAEPGLRQLAVVEGLGAQGVAASICPRQGSDPTAPDYGYRPAIDALLRTMARSFEE